MTEKKSLEELRKMRDELKKDLEELKHEEQMVLASITNANHMALINELTNTKKPPQHLRELANMQKMKQKQSRESNEVNENKLMQYYATLTGITVNNVSVKALPLSEDTNYYLYETDANIDSLRFTLTYQSNKPPDKDAQDTENIKQLTITLERSVYQKEIQEGLDFFSEHPTYIPSAILFLKSVNTLINIRKNICNELHSKYEKYFQLSKDDKGFFIIKCSGILQPECSFIISWQVKFDETNYSARDSFIVSAILQGKQLENDTKPIFKQMTKHSLWKSLSFEEKLNLFVGVAQALVDADGTEHISDVTVVSEYSSVM